LSSQGLDVAPLICMLAQGSAAAAYKNACLVHRPIALSLRVSLTLGMTGGRGSPGRATCRTSVYFTDTGRHHTTPHHATPYAVRDTAMSNNFTLYRAHVRPHASPCREGGKDCLPHRLREGPPRDDFGRSRCESRARATRVPRSCTS